MFDYAAAVEARPLYRLIRIFSKRTTLYTSRMQDQLEIASATGVDLQLNVAGPGARSYAFVVDWHIRLLLALAWYIVANFAYLGSLEFMSPDSTGFSTYSFVVLFPPTLIYGLYHPVLEIVMRGRTPGKRMAGIRIVTQDAQTPGVFAILIRNVLRLLDSLPIAYAVGLVCTMLTKQAVRIGDIAAGTLLVYDADAEADTGKSMDLDPEAVAEYGLEKTELIHELLDRWEALDVERRQALASTLLRQLRPEETVQASHYRFTLEKMVRRKDV